MPHVKGLQKQKCKNLNKLRGGMFTEKKCLIFNVLSVNEIIFHKTVTVINQYINTINFMT